MTTRENLTPLLKYYETSGPKIYSNKKLYSKTCKICAADGRSSGRGFNKECINQRAGSETDDRMREEKQ